MATEAVVTRADVVAAARAWIGTPYVHQASLRGVGCDCLGLLRGVWRALFGDEPEALPNYAFDHVVTAGAEVLHVGLRRHLDDAPMGALLPADVALIRWKRHQPATHCGIVAEQDGTATLIHARANRVVTEDPLATVGRLAFGLRLRGLADFGD